MINGIVFSILNLHEHKYCSSEAGVSKEKTTMKYTYFPAGNYMLKVNNTNTKCRLGYVRVWNNTKYSKSACISIKMST